MLKALYSVVSVIAILYVLGISFFSGGPIGFVVAFILISLIAVAGTIYKKRQKNTFQPSTFNPQKTRIARSAFVVIVVIIGVTPIIGIGGFVVNCQIQRRTADKEFEPIFDQFDAVYFLSESSKPTTAVSKGGDCVDSRPWVSVTKSQSINLKSDQAIADIDAALAKQGYSIDKNWLNYSYRGEVGNLRNCNLTVSTQIVSQDSTTPYKTFPLTLRSDTKPCNSKILTDKYYGDIPITKITLYAQRSN